MLAASPAVPLTRFRWTSDGDLIREPKQGFILVHFLNGYFSADLKSFLSIH
jgi:hypothetical protein